MLRTLLLFAALCSPALAQPSTNPSGVLPCYGPASVSVTGCTNAASTGGKGSGPRRVANYSGPGDIRSGAAAWYGLRAYNQAQAIAGAKAIQLCTATACGAGTTEDELVNVTGKMVFGTKALTCDNGANQCFVGKLYDQSGNGLDLPAQGTTKAQFVINCIGTLPCVKFVRANSNNFGNSTIGISALPLTIQWVAQRNGNFTLQQAIISFQHLSDNAPTDYFNNGTNALLLFAGTVQHVTAADSTWHAEVTVYNNLTTPGAILDGAATTLAGSAGNTAPSGSNFCIGASGSCTNTNNADMLWVEGGAWGVAFTAAQGVTVDVNAKSYWGY